MEGDAGHKEGAQAVATTSAPASNVDPVCSGGPAAAAHPSHSNPYNLMAYNVFNGKPGAPPPFYPNGPLYVAQPAMMYGGPLGFSGFLPFPSPPFPPAAAQELEEKVEDKKPQIRSDASDSDDSQLSKERGAAKRSRAAQPSGQQRQAEGLATPSKYPEGAVNGNDAALAAALAAGNGGADFWRQRSAQFAGPGVELNTMNSGSLGQGNKDDREEKRQRRKQSNRESARRSRLRKQAECEGLSEKVMLLEAENERLKAENKQLREQLESLGAPPPVQNPHAEARQDSTVDEKPLELLVREEDKTPVLTPQSLTATLQQPLPMPTEDAKVPPSMGELCLDGSPDGPRRQQPAAVAGL